MYKSKPIELTTFCEYDSDRSQQYLIKHRTGLARRVSNWRDMQLARRALKDAGEPNLVLDLPCGAGRFWPLLAEAPNRTILAADYSADMLDTARQGQASELVARVKTFQTSAFDIELGDNAVDNIFCMRLIHHVADHEHRIALLRECARVTRDTLIISLWVDGNLNAWKRRRLEARRGAMSQDGQSRNRFVVARDVVEKEFREVGFKQISYRDFLPGYSMWRVYTLRKVSA